MCSQESEMVVLKLVNTYWKVLSYFTFLMHPV